MAIQPDHDETILSSADEAAIRDLCYALLEDWGRGDGYAYGSRFTEDADYVAFDGSRTKGRKEIASWHQKLFDRWLKGTRLVGRIENIKLLSPEVALVHATGGTLFPGNSKAVGPIVRVLRDLMLPRILKRAASGNDSLA